MLYFYSASVIVSIFILGFTELCSTLILTLLMQMLIAYIEKVYQTGIWRFKGAVRLSACLANCNSVKTTLRKRLYLLLF